MDDFESVLSEVKSKTYPYKERKKKETEWRLYDEAQKHKYPDVLELIGKVVDEASRSYRLLRRDVIGKPGYRADNIVKAILAQQYEGKPDRVTEGYISLVMDRLGIDELVDYKTNENAYSDYDVMMILNYVFFITQQPVLMLERRLSIDVNALARR